jgi:hypothetical protein
MIPRPAWRYNLETLNNLILVVCILLRVLDQVQCFRLTQHCFNSFLLFYSITDTCFGRIELLLLKKIVNNYSNNVVLDGNPGPDETTYLLLHCYLYCFFKSIHTRHKFNSKVQTSTKA